MPATFGAISPSGLPTPQGGYLQESSRESSVEVVAIRNATAESVKVATKPLVTTVVTIKGKGDANLASVAAGSFAAGTLRVTSAKQSESNDDFPDFEITGTAYSNLA